MRIELALQRDDRELVASAREGDVRSFRMLVERYQHRVYGIAYGIVRNEDDAMDVAQEAFIKVHRYLPRFQGTSSFYTWLYRIVVNLCIDHKRKAGRATEVDFDDTLDHGKSAEEAEGRIQGTGFQSPEKSFRNAELREELSRAMNGLSEKHRQVILLREVEGLSYKEIAEVLEISVGTVMSRLHHARQNMQGTLKRFLKRE